MFSARAGGGTGDNTVAARNARGDHSVVVAAPQPGATQGNPILPDELFKDLLVGGEYPGHAFQWTYGQLLSGAAAADLVRSAFSMFIKPEYAERVHSVLASSLNQTELFVDAPAGTPRALRSFAHAGTAFVRAKKHAIANKLASEDFFHAQPGELYHFGEIEQRLAPAGAAPYYVAAAAPGGHPHRKIQAERLAGITLQDAIAHDFLPAILAFADARMPRAATDGQLSHEHGCFVRVARRTTPRLPKSVHASQTCALPWCLMSAVGVFSSDVQSCTL